MGAFLSICGKRRIIRVKDPGGSAEYTYGVMLKESSSGGTVEQDSGIGQGKEKENSVECNASYGRGYVDN